MADMIVQSKFHYYDGYFTGVSIADIVNTLNQRYGGRYVVAFFTTTTTDGFPAGMYLAMRNIVVSAGVRVVALETIIS